MGADVLVSCAGGSLGCFPMPSLGEELIVKEILDNGTVIVMAAGNGLGGHHCGTPPNNYHAFYPFNPEYDERIIIVTSTDFDDNHQFFYGTNEATHSHFPEVDICSPGYDIMGATTTDCGANQWPYYGSYGGTSFSSPIVAGVCALLKSVNADFTPGEIQHFIKSTADPVTDANNYPGMLGAGRINAFKAVEMAFNCAPKEITTNETWNNDKVIACGVEIINNATLTITSKIKLSKHSEIIIERGSKLIIDGGTLTSLDNKLWKGIQAWGDPTQPHTNESAHGVVELKNGAVIENAYCAIATTRRDENGQLVNGYHGGIIKAEQTTFENNKRAVEIWPFDFTNKSYFKRCSFITSEELPNNNNFEYFIIMSDVDGVTIEGCDFENTRPAFGYTMDHRGIGIFSNESQYSVSAYDPQGSNIENYFGKLEYGILAHGFTTAKTPSIKACSLEYNRTGIYLGGITSASVLSNYFLVESFDTDYDQNTFCGLYIDNSTQYHIEDNLFEHDINTSQSEDHTIGITVNNSGEQANEIYRNTFKTLDIGILAQNNNRNENGTAGLLIKCNDFGDNDPADPSLHDNTIDIAVTCYPECINPGIKRSQGSDEDQASPAGNRFSQASNGIVDSDFSNPNTLRPFYYQHDPTNEPRVNLTYYIPLHVTKIPTDYDFVESECCPPSLVPGGSGEMQSAISEYQGDADSVNSLLTDLVDGGNTQELENDIIFSSPNIAYELHSDLMMKSPYLTDTVMIEAINKEDVLNSVMVKEVLVANPQAAKSEEVMDELSNRINPLPDYMVVEIEQGNYTLSAKEVMESAKHNYSHRKEITTNDLKRKYKIDTTEETYRDSLIDFLTNENLLKSKYELAFEYFNKKDYSNANIVVSNIPSDYTLNIEEDDVYQKYSDYFDIIIDLKQNNKFIYDLDSAQVNTLDSLSNDIYSYPGAYARNILVYNEIVTYTEPYILPDSTLKIEEIGYPLQKPFDDYSSFKVYPNPAKNYITIEYEVISSNCQAYVEFINLQGKSISLVELQSGSYSKIIPLNNSFTSGTYICKLVKDGEVIEIKKITIIR